MAGNIITAAPDAVAETIDAIVCQYVDAAREGSPPDLEQFLAAHPAFADELRELLPLVARLERWGTAKEIECVRQSLPVHFPLKELGEYRLVRELGRGGMGVVFHAEHRFSSRAVALKLLPYRLGADLPQRQAQFRQEVDAIARLQHPHIVPIYSFGEEGGYFYYVMQLIHGMTLSGVIERLRERDEPFRCRRRRQRTLATATTRVPPGELQRSSWKAFAGIGVHVAEALQHAHSAGILHNDIKPANIMLDSTGRAVITDFSGSGLFDGAAQEEQRLALGTLRYMAPERLYKQCDERSDVYSLGVTLYELVTQSAAFSNLPAVKLTEAIERGDIIAPRWHAPDLPTDLAAIIMRAMHPDPAQRQESARELHGELLDFLWQRPSRRPSTSWWQRRMRSA
ncbi:MAG TPA: serine/threonine-protein kinase [Planctomycetaceae bacterium]|nr:serine/threonine-protein kinase [Planctomycetaceae bacterium]